MLHGHSGNWTDLMGVYDRDGECNGMPRFKSRDEQGGFIYCNRWGSWSVGPEQDMPEGRGCIVSIAKGALLPLGLRYAVGHGVGGSSTMC